MGHAETDWSRPIDSDSETRGRIGHAYRSGEAILEEFTGGDDPNAADSDEEVEEEERRGAVRWC